MPFDLPLKSPAGLDTDFNAELEAGLLPMKRRRFLGMLAQSALVTGLGALVSACGDQSTVTLPAAKVLSAGEVAFFTRLAAVLLPTEGTALTPLQQVPVIANLDHLFAQMDPDIRGDLGSAIQLFEHAGLVTGWHFARFTRMPSAEAIAYIDSWHQGIALQQGIVVVLKKLVYAAYWRDESTWSVLQFDGPVSLKWGLPSLGEAPLPQSSQGQI